MLSPSYQEEIGYDSYRGFWATMADVAVTGTRPSGKGAVDVSLTYTHNDGRTEPEVRRVFLERSGDGYLISGSQIVAG